MYLLKNLFITSTILLTRLTLIGCTNTSTICYGVLGPSCTTHRLYCNSPLVIQIINTTYGYRPGCNNIIGLSNCINTTCCDEEPGDCFIQFSSDENQQVLRNCSGLETCTVYRFLEVYGRECGGTTSAYSKIQYKCVLKGSSITTSTLTTYIQTTTIAPTDITTPSSTETPSIQPTPKLSTAIPSNSVVFATTSLTTGAVFATTSLTLGSGDEDTSNVGSIVGGIFGVIIIIVIIIVVVVFLYKRKKKSPPPPSTDKKTIIQTVTPHCYVIDGPGSINSSKDISGYDEIELDNKPKVQATATHLNSSIIKNGTDGIKLDRKPKILIVDNYDQVGDDKLKVKSPKELDNYNHIGTHDHSVHEDNYNHIGNNPLVSSNHLESDYNHINGVFETDEDDYNHIGNNDNNHVITDDNYHHIGSGDIKMEGDYDHI